MVTMKSNLIFILFCVFSIYNVFSYDCDKICSENDENSFWDPENEDTINVGVSGCECACKNGYKIALEVNSKGIPYSMNNCPYMWADDAPLTEEQKENMACGDTKFVCVKEDCPENSVYVRNSSLCDDNKLIFDYCCCNNNFIAFGDYCSEAEFTLKFISPEMWNETSEYKKGDLVAKFFLEGNAIVNEKIVFYVENEGNLNWAFKNSFPSTEWIKIYNDLEVDRNSYLGYSYTNDDGYAVFNVFSDMNVFDSQGLFSAIEDKGMVFGRISAIVIDDLGEEVISKASTSVNIDYVAKIINIENKNSNLKKIVRVMPKNEGSRAVEIDELPYKLNFGDAVLFQEGEMAEIEYLSGKKLSVSVKEDFLKEGEMGKLVIGNEFSRAAVGIVDLFDYEIVDVGSVFGPLVIGAYYTKAGLILSTPGAFVFGYNKGDKWFNPLILKMNSYAVIDFEEGSVKTIEGEVEVYDFQKQNFVNNPKNNMIKLENESFLYTEKFNSFELNEEEKFVYKNSGMINRNYNLFEFFKVEYLLLFIIIILVVYILKLKSFSKDKISNKKVIKK